MPADSLAKLSAAAADPYTGWRQRYPGRRAALYICSYAPAEVIGASGLVPVRVLPRGCVSPLADAHIQSYACSVARSCLSRGLEGELDFAEGIVFSHTCDTMQCLADIWGASLPRMRLDCLLVPTLRRGRLPAAYLVGELKRLLLFLSRELGAEATRDSLRASVELHNRVRELLRRVRAELPGLPAGCLHDVSVAAVVMPREDYCSLVTSLLEEGEEYRTPRPGVPVLVSGALVDRREVLSCMEEAGARVVFDDLCTGWRCAEGEADPREDPLAALAAMYLARTPCPCKQSEPNERLAYLRDRARASGARGIIFLAQKFCDPHAWECGKVSRRLRESGLPHLVVEVEAGTALEQLRARVQAFVEMLQERGPGR